MDFSLTQILPSFSEELSQLNINLGTVFENFSSDINDEIVASTERQQDIIAMTRKLSKTCDKHKNHKLVVSNDKSLMQDLDDIILSITITKSSLDETLRRLNKAQSQLGNDDYLRNSEKLYRYCKENKLITTKEKLQQYEQLERQLGVSTKLRFPLKQKSESTLSLTDNTVLADFEPSQTESSLKKLFIDEAS
ncbi:hypothetical protein LJB42_000585 [Komagataella kurtzmanii]|nr:hypothetical protein LJB42_000585 [Komagataella kurtzmanii]